MGTGNSTEVTHVGDFALPARLVKLIDSGAWANANLGEPQAHELSPDDDHIVLMPPAHFRTIAKSCEGNSQFWIDGLTNVDYERAVIIADFGLGSDSAIILYYGAADEEPCVMYLKWEWDEERNARHSWVTTHRTFDELADAVGL